MLHLPRQSESARSRVRWFVVLSVCVVGAGLLAASEREPAHHVTAVRFWSLDDVTRIVVETDGEFSVRSDHLENPDRLFYDLTGTKPNLGPKAMTVIPVSDRLVRQIRVAAPQRGVTRVVLDLEGAAEATTSRLEDPDRLIIEVRRAGDTAARPSFSKPAIEAERSEALPPLRHTFTPPPAYRQKEAAAKRAPAALPEPPVAMGYQPVQPSAAANVIPKVAPAPMRPVPVAVLAKASVSAAPVVAPNSAAPELPSATYTETPLPAKRNAMGGRSMIRVLGLKVGRIVLDPGHGGHDTGTIGPGGMREKDLVLDVAKRLGALLEQRLGSEVIYTRTDDTFVPLEQRTEIANQAKADLFLSIHANSSPLRSAAGVETYYLSLTTSKAALELAARENAGSQQSIFELQNLLEKIALKDKVDESREFAAKIQTALYSFSAKTDSHARDRGVRKAPFVVLIGASMPSVLSEIGFISNVRDENAMKRSEYRQRLAEALYKGVSNYANTLSHFQVAQRH